MSLPKTKITVIRNDTPTSSIVSPVDTLDVKDKMRTLFIVDSATNFYHKIYGTDAHCMDSADVLPEMYSIEDKFISEFFKVTTDFYLNSNIAYAEGQFKFMRIPDSTIDGYEVDWTNVTNEISSTDRIAYVCNLTDKDFASELNLMSLVLEKNPHNKPVIIIDKVPSFAKGAMVYMPTREQDLYKQFDVKNFKTVYVPTYHSKFVDANVSPDVTFWEMGESFSSSVDCILTGFETNPASNKRVVTFFIPPVILKDKTFNIVDASLDNGLIDLRGTISMFYIGRMFETHDKQQLLNKDDISCVKTINSSDEMFFGISELLSNSTYRISMLENGIDGAEQGRIKYVRTKENIYKELEEVCAIETSDAMTILIKETLKDAVQQNKTVTPENINSIRLIVKSFIDNLNEKKTKFIKKVSLESFGLDTEFPDVLLMQIQTNLFSVVKNVEVVLNYSI